MRSLDVIGAPTPKVLPLVYCVNHGGTVSMYPRVFCECSCVRQGPYAWTLPSALRTDVPIEGSWFETTL